MADLFDLGDLPPWLREPEVKAETATRVRRWASGWLMSATRLTTWPDPIPDPLWAWALELAGIAYRNHSEGAESDDDFARRKEILAAARAMYQTGATQPQYSFPEPDWSWEVSSTSIQ